MNQGEIIGTKRREWRKIEGMERESGDMDGTFQGQPLVFTLWTA